MLGVAISTAGKAAWAVGGAAVAAVVAVSGKELWSERQERLAADRVYRDEKARAAAVECREAEERAARREADEARAAVLRSKPAALTLEEMYWAMTPAERKAHDEKWGIPASVKPGWARTPSRRG